MQCIPGRTDLWWQNMVNDVLPESEWYANFRISKKDFNDLVEMIKPYAEEKSTRFRSDTIPLEKRVAMTLYYLKDQGHLRMIANTFGCSKATNSDSTQ